MSTQQLANANHIEMKGTPWLVNVTSLRKRVANLCLGMLLVIGLFAPTSVGTIISTNLQVLTSLIAAVLFLVLVLAVGIRSSLSLVFAISIPAILLVATVASPSSILTPGAVAYYIPLACLYLLNLRAIRITLGLKRLFFVTNLLVVGLGIALVTDIKIVESFFLSWYAMYYDSLLRNMILWANKPVLTFATHSVAATMLFLFFYVNVNLGFSTRERIWLVFGIAFLLLLWFLSSVTAIGMIFLGVLYLAYRLIPRRQQSLSIALVLACIAVVLGVLVVVFRGESLLSSTIIAWEQITEIISSPNNGIWGRFATNGALASNIAYLQENPLSPIGVTLVPNLVLVDNGPLEYLLRGSLPFLFVVYLGIFCLLWFNLYSRKQALFLFVLILLTEIGFSYLRYYRFQMLLPFFIVVLNHNSSPPATHNGTSQS